MTDTSIQTRASSLVEGPTGVAEKPSESLIAQVSAEYGVHPLKQLAQIVGMRLGTQKLSAHEYYDLRLFDPVRTGAERKAFLGQGGINALNRAINPDSVLKTKNFVGNKLVYTAHLNANGIATTETQAFVTTQYASDAALVVKDAASLVAFMKSQAVYPLFCKPQGGSLSVGSVRIDRIDGDTLHLGTGRTVSVAQFANDVLRVYPDGYLIQSAIVPHNDLQPVTGKAVGCVRIVTAIDGNVAKPVYAVWKIPAPNAMSDNSWQDGTSLALIELASGIIKTCRRGKGFSAEDVPVDPTSGAQILGLQMPHWTEALKNACVAHELTPELGVCGFDVAITDGGPIILECNDQPNHMMYQFSSQRGARNPEFSLVWDRLLKRAKS